MTRGLERRKPTDLVRSYAFKITGEVTVTRKTQMPHGGTLIEGPILMVATLVLNSDGSFRRLRSNITGRRLFRVCWMLLLFLLHTEIFALRL